MDITTRKVADVTIVDFKGRLAIGVSDSHNAGRTNSPSQSPVGTGATAVHAKELSEKGIRCAVKAGHTYAKIGGANGLLPVTWAARAEPEQSGRTSPEELIAAIKTCWDSLHSARAVAYRDGARFRIVLDEILVGKRQDKHLQFVIEALAKRGLRLSWAQYLGDEPARITAAMSCSRRPSSSSGAIRPCSTW